MLDIEEELRRVIEAFDDRGLPYALAGGIAVSIYTTPRTTEDIDLLIRAVDLDQALQVLQPLGFQRAGSPMSVAQAKLRIQRLTKISGLDLLPLDLLLADSPLLDDIMHTRQRLDWGTRSVWVVSLGGLRTLKRLRASPQDLADLEALGPEEEA